MQVCCQWILSHYVLLKITFFHSSFWRIFLLNIPYRQTYFSFCILKSLFPCHLASLIYCEQSTDICIFPYFSFGSVLRFSFYLWFLAVQHSLSSYGLLCIDPVWGLLNHWIYKLILGASWCSDGKESACQCKRHGFDSWIERIPWRRKWQSTPVFLPGKFHRQRSLASCSPWSFERVGHDLEAEATTTTEVNWRN